MRRPTDATLPLAGRTEEESLRDRPGRSSNSPARGRHCRRRAWEQVQTRPTTYSPITVYSFYMVDSTSRLALVLIGPPGVGKGTQAARLCDEFDLAHVAT